MAKASVNVHSATISQVKFARGVAFVLGRENWRRQKWRLTLAAMRVSGKNPSAKVAPHRAVCHVWIVAKDQSWCGLVQSRQDALRGKAWPPEVVQTNDLETVYGASIIPKHHNSQPKQLCCDPRSEERRVGTECISRWATS